MKAVLIVASVAFAEDVGEEFVDIGSDGLRTDVQSAVKQHFADMAIEIEHIQVGLGEPLSTEDLQDEIAKGAEAALAPPVGPDPEVQAECEHVWEPGYTHCQRGCGMTWYAWRQQQRGAGL